MGCGATAQPKPGDEKLNQETRPDSAGTDDVEVDGKEVSRRIERHSLLSADSLRAQPGLPSRDLQKRLSFLYEERQAARQDAGFGVATQDHEQPIALWLLGPSAVGKTTQAKLRAKDFGIADQDGTLDAVIVDGEFFRDAHETYQEWVQTDDWKAAYPALKSRINREKKAMLHDAKVHKVHLIIPQTCLNLESCLDEITQLTEAGYTNHVIAIQAPKEEVVRRGTRRAEADGKVYDPSHFDQSVAAIGPMIQAANGRSLHLYVRERPGGSTAGFEVTVTSEGWCGRARQSIVQSTECTSPAAAQVLTVT